MRFQILTIFPELFERFREVGLVGRACAEEKIAIDPIHLRDFAINTHGQIDDSPYGGGSGMVLRPDAAVAAINAAKAQDPEAKVVLFTPRGKPFSQRKAREMAASGHGYIFLCCRYEGVDERVVEHWVDDEICLGDYVLMGGETPAMVCIEAVSRLLPGVLGNPESIEHESFESGLLEHPHYTKPAEYEGKGVPEVLLSGNHRKIEEWRQARSLSDTAARRPDLLQFGRNPGCELSVALIHHPVLNKRGEVIISSVTNLDLHDIARSSRTFGLAHYYVVHPTKSLRRLSEKICEHWESGFGAEYNPNRSDALRTISIVPDLDDVLTDIEARTGRMPKVITTSARDESKAVSFTELRGKIYGSQEPHLLLLGTGWGLTREIIDRAEYHLEPVRGHSNYNHLSVRAAAAIIFDRLFGDRRSSV